MNSIDISCRKVYGLCPLPSFEEALATLHISCVRRKYYSNDTCKYIAISKSINWMDINKSNFWIYNYSPKSSICLIPILRRSIRNVLIK